MTDADGSDWPPEIRNPPELPVIHGRNGTVYRFGSNESAFRIMNGITPNTPDKYTVVHNIDGSRTLEGYTLSTDDTYRDASGILRATATGIALKEMYPSSLNWAKEKDTLSMDNEEVLRRRIEQARRDIDEYSEKLGWLESLPTEPDIPEDGDGPVIYFRKTFGDVEKVEKNEGSQYAAVRVDTGTDAHWFITGSKRMSAMALTWRQILAFVFMGEIAETSPRIWIASGWDALL